MIRMRKPLAVIAAILVIAAIGFVADANLRIATQENLTPEAGARGHFVDVSGRRMHVLTMGDVTADPSGAPLLLIHGFGMPGQSWLPWAARLTVTRALIIPDLIGFGHSERAATPGAHYTLEGRAAALVAMLDALNVPRVDIVGESLGGAIAAQFALDYPERVRRVVFMGAAIYPHPNIGPQLGLLPFGLGRALTWHAIGSGPFGAPAQQCGTQPTCPWLESVRVAGTVDSLRAMALTTRDNGAEDELLPQRISAIRAPSLVLWGGNDAIVPVSDGDRLAQALKTNIAIIAEAGHVPYLEQPDKVAIRVTNFLNTP